MAPAAKDRRVVSNLIFYPKWFSFLKAFSSKARRKKINGPKRISYEVPKTDINGPKRISYEVPKTDMSKLIIEEIGMGSANGPRAERGRKVTLKIKFKPEDGQVARRGDIPFTRYDVVLGKDKMLAGLHDGVIGMRPRDVRKITVPPSIRNEDESISESTCEITLLKIH